MSEPAVVLDRVSRWYGDVLGVNEVTLELGPGVTGLLGPNGAGKSTLIKLICGFLRPELGTIRVLGHDPFTNRAVQRDIGLCPEQDAAPTGQSALSYLTYLNRLQGFERDPAKKLAEMTLDHVGLGGAMKRSVSQYSKGMRQRFKLAQAIAHEPHVVVLDEPMNGLDPPSRRDFADAIRRLGGEGRCVLVSSHVLHEVESVAERIVVMQRGRMLADGTPRDLRAELAEVPLTVRITTTAPADLAERLVALEGVRDVERGSDLLQVRTTRADALFDTLAALAAEEGAPRILSAEPVDESLEAVFEYLTR
ncbi:MAG: ABC transporter ATP-binding protein [Planctomycetes bacterium]|nr:ABC transporter ATP-binding protein [Planctomycetota bacterium]